MKLALTFALLVLAGGAGGMLGSMIGAAVRTEGNTDLFVGGVLGGLLMSAAGAAAAARFGWIAAADTRPTAIGAALGFIAAVAIALNTLSSPIGPVVSTLLVGAGGLAGRAIGRRSAAR